MKITRIYAGQDGHSHFEDIDAGPATQERLGLYSKAIAATGLIFRTFKKGELFDWHNAPQPQYILYLEGMVEVEVSGRKKMVFKPGDVLFADDLSGKGHVTRTLTSGRSAIVTTR